MFSGHGSLSIPRRLPLCRVSGFSGMGIVEWWNDGMDFFSSILFASLCTNYFSVA